MIQCVWESVSFVYNFIVTGMFRPTALVNSRERHDKLASSISSLDCCLVFLGFVTVAIC